MGQYDRGMVYRFNDDLSGEVIHEVKKDDIEYSYLGLTFPHTDIPQSARMLYVKNILRYIRDANGEDVPIFSNEGAIDLTQTRARCVHKSHLIYLKNMGVVSSMSIAIISEGELWGLFSFHGYKQPFKPTLHQRMACETIASCVSARVEGIAKKVQTTRLVRLGQLLKKWKPTAHVKDNLELLGNQILDILEADVLAGEFVMEDAETSRICTVTKGDMTLIPGAHFWTKMAVTPHFDLCAKSTRASIEELGLTLEDCPAAGFVYFRGEHMQIMVGRAYRGRDVAWGGSPDTPKLKIGGILHPRASFETQLEKSKQESRPFNPSDLTLVNLLRDRILRQQSNSWMLCLLENDIGEANISCFHALEQSEDNNDFLGTFVGSRRFFPFGRLLLLFDHSNQLISSFLQQLTCAMSSVHPFME